MTIKLESLKLLEDKLDDVYLYEFEFEVEELGYPVQYLLKVFDPTRYIGRELYELYRNGDTTPVLTAGPFIEPGVTITRLREIFEEPETQRIVREVIWFADNYLRAETTPVPEDEELDEDVTMLAALIIDGQRTYYRS